jgi:predicted nucleotidyltransferase
MRLSNREIRSIENAFTATFGKGEIYLFGSRTNDALKGGDIDLFIVPESINDLAEKKIDFLVKLKRYIGEQRIDVVIDRGENRPIDKKAKSAGVLLCRK